MCPQIHLLKIYTIYKGKKVLLKNKKTSFSNFVYFSPKIKIKIKNPNDFILEKGRNHRFQLISPKHLFLLKFLAATRVLFFFPQFCSEKINWRMFPKMIKISQIYTRENPKTSKKIPPFFFPQKKDKENENPWNLQVTTTCLVT